MTASPQENSDVVVFHADDKVRLLTV